MHIALLSTLINIYYISTPSLALHIMGNTVEQWRATIGGFCQPVKTITRLKKIKVKYSTCISLAIKVVLFMMLVVEGVGSNPAPRSNTNDPSQGRGRCGRENRG